PPLDARLVPGESAGQLFLFPVEGGEPRTVPFVRHRDRPVQWSPSGDALYVRVGEGPTAAEIQRLDLATGRRQPWRTLVPADRVGLEGLWTVAVTPDGQAYCYEYDRANQALFVVEGVRGLARARSSFLTQGGEGVQPGGPPGGEKAGEKGHRQEDH